MDLRLGDKVALRAEPIRRLALDEAHARRLRAARGTVLEIGVLGSKWAPPVHIVTVRWGTADDALVARYLVTHADPKLRKEC